MFVRSLLLAILFFVITPTHSKAVEIQKSNQHRDIETLSISWPFFKNPDYWVKKHRIKSVVVYKEGKIIYEKYSKGSSSTLFLGQSMAKTLTAIVVGIAYDEKKIRLDDPIETYLPQMIGTPLGRVSIRNHLKMASGSELNQRNINKYGKITSLQSWQKTQTVDKEGEVFNYDSQSSILLSALISEIYKKPTSQVWEERVWKRLGTEHNATWESTPFNITVGSRGFSASSRDWIRVSQLWLEAQNIISQEWLDLMISDNIRIVSREDGNWSRSHNPTHYGYQLWIKDDDWFCLAGRGGNKLLIDRKSKTSMLVTSFDGDWNDDGIGWFEWLTEKNLDSLIK